MSENKRPRLQVDFCAQLKIPTTFLALPKLSVLRQPIRRMVPPSPLKHLHFGPVRPSYFVGELVG